MGTEKIDCMDLPVVLKTPYVANVSMCEACSPRTKEACPAAKDLYYGRAVDDRGSDHLRCELITALVKGNVEKALQLGEKVEDHHGRDLGCDPLTGVKKIRGWLRKMGVELGGNRSAQGLEFVQRDRF